MILTVFNCDKSVGTLFVEAHKLAHVKAVLEGISGVYRRGIEMIPFKDMTHLLNTCSTMSAVTLEPHQWVRVKSGIYQGDLGLVEMIEGNARALVKLIPRIPKELYSSTSSTAVENSGAAMGKKFMRDSGALGQSVH